MRSRINSIMVIIGPEHPELFALEFDWLVFVDARV